MSHRTLRIFTVLSVSVLLGLAGLQFHWFRQAHLLEDRDFDRRVTSALRVVCQRIIAFNHRPNQPPLKPVERVASNYYTVQINDQINPTALEAYLRQEFVRNDIKTNFEYGIYDCVQSRIRYGGFVCHSQDCDSTQALKYQFPALAVQNYYFGVYFPEKRSYLFSQLDSWVLATLALLVVMLFLGYALWVIFQQKRYAELQRDFVNNLTHEFKTPLSTILISTDVLAKPNQSPDRLAHYARIIRNEALRLKQQVDTVLQTAQQENNISSIQLETIDSQVFINNFSESIRPRLREHNAALHLVVEPTLFMADSLHLSNILHNLVDNALKYTHRDTPQLHLSCKKVALGVAISLSDDGIGIDTAHQKRIFERFYRVPTGDVHNVKGFGLGLFYAKTMVEAMQGKLTVTSQPNAGCSFTILLKAV